MQDGEVLGGRSLIRAHWRGSQRRERTAHLSRHRTDCGEATGWRTSPLPRRSPPIRHWCGSSTPSAASGTRRFRPNPAHVRLGEHGARTRRPLLSLHAECRFAARAGRIAARCPHAWPPDAVTLFATSLPHASLRRSESLSHSGGDPALSGVRRDGTSAHLLVRRSAVSDGTHPPATEGRDGAAYGRHFRCGGACRQLRADGATQSCHERSMSVPRSRRTANISTKCCWERRAKYCRALATGTD